LRGVYLYVTQEGRSGLEIPLTNSRAADGRQILIRSARTKSRAVACMTRAVDWMRPFLSTKFIGSGAMNRPLDACFCENWHHLHRSVGLHFDLGASFIMLPQLRQLRFHSESTARGTSVWSTALVLDQRSIDCNTFRWARAACAGFPQTGSTYVRKASVLILALLS